MPRPAAPPNPRLVLKPALRRLWRDAGTLQLGVAGAHAVVLHGVDGSTRTVLALLDGTRDTAALLDDAVAAGVDRDDVRGFLDTLTQAGVLDDAAVPLPGLSEDERQRLEPDVLSLSLRHPAPGAAAGVLDRRRRSVVAVHGTGRVGAGVAMLLGAAGVGRLACLDEAPLHPRDVSPGGLPRMATGERGRITAIRAARFAATVHADASNPREVTLALLTPTSSVALPELVTGVRDVPHLLACVSETTGIVGPLVVPGRTPCLRCVALARGERDPHWPVLSAQLVGSVPPVEPCDVALASLVASVAALQALAFIDGDAAPATYGGIVEYELATGRLRRRSITPHRDCGCGAGTDEHIPTG